MTASPPLPGLDGNAVVAASAGTGKTQLITSIYIAHVLGLGHRGRIAPERIVATTFSRLAAQEIRERLERRLGALVSDLEGGRDALDPALAAPAAARGLGPRELATRARRALEELPRSLIDTLHGLAARVIRSIALEVGLSPGFTILDEQQAFEDAENAIEDALTEALGRDPAARHAVVRLIDTAGGLEATRSTLMGFLSVLDEEGLDADALATFDADAESRALSAVFSSAAQALLSGDTDPEIARAARNALAALGRSPVDIDALEAAFGVLVEVRAPKLARLPGGKAFTAALDELLEGKSKADRLHASCNFLRFAPELAAESRAIGALVGAVQRAVRARRRARGALGFGDLLRIARDALRDRPELAARAGADIDLLLVDEFQDTSRVQRDLILLLRERPDARAARAPGTLPRADAILPEGLVVVGDRKQSIYAFRGADVSVYAELVAELAGEPAARALGMQGVSTSAAPVADFVPLTQNYRSGADILRFVNALCRLDFCEAPREPFEIRYSDAEALTPAAASGRGTGKVTVLVDDGTVPDGADPLLAGAEGALRTALVVAGYVACAAAAGTPLAEIAILARRRSSLPMLEQALDRVGIPFVVSGRALYTTPEVRDLAALLRVVQDPYNRHALAVVARSPLGGLSDRTLAELSLPQRGLPRATAWNLEAISDPAQKARARELAQRLGELEVTLPLLSPRDALSCAVERFELEAVLGALPRGAVRFGNVGRLMEIAGRRGGSLSMFSRWLDRQIALETDESEAAVFSEDDDAVRLLTIHASKGLSFPVTVLVDTAVAEQSRTLPLSILRTNDGPPTLVVRHRGPDGNVPTPLARRAARDAQARALAERQRLSYVALTRAERELVIALPPKPKRGSLSESLDRLLTSEAAAELPIERVEARDLLEVPAAPRAPLDLPSPPPPKPSVVRLSSLAIGVTALADFALCARRFSLLHVIGVSEPGAPFGEAKGPTDDARALGSAAHRVLERVPLERWGAPIPLADIIRELEREGLDGAAPESLATAEGIQRFLQGAYARQVAESGARVERELALDFLVAFPAPSGPRAGQLDLFAATEPPRRAVVKAMLDLVVHHADGSVDVIDYKRSKGGDDERYLPQLELYAEAARSAFGARSVRTGLVHLLAPSAEPVWLTRRELDVPGLLSRLADARYRNEYPRTTPEMCRRARCGFFGACYPRRRR